MTLLVSVAGAAAFLLAGWPLPLLLGPMVACLVAAVTSVPMQAMGALGQFMRTFLGVAIGTSVTPEILTRLPGLALSLAMVPLYILLVGATGHLFFRALGFDRQTSIFASMPGGLQEMLFLGEEAGGNLRAMSLIHATRVLAIFAAAPFAISAIWGVDLTGPPGNPAADLPPMEIALMVLSGFVGWKVAAWARIPGPSLLGPILLSMTLSLTGLISSRPPAEMLLAAQFFIGMAVGVRYAGITLDEVRRYVVAGILFSLITAAISVVFFLAIAAMLSLDSLDVLLSFLPGGQAEMAMIAIIAGNDVTLVISHHILRIIIVILVAQAMLGWVRRR